MILTIGDWIFDVDIKRTSAYSQREAAEHCECDHCRNFYQGMDGSCPQLRSILGQFGICADAPDRMSPVAFSEEMIDYDPMYYVFGQIIRYGEHTIQLGDVEIVPESADALFEEGTVFALYVNGLSIPWRMDAPFEDTVFQRGYDNEIPQ